MENFEKRHFKVPESDRHSSGEVLIGDKKIAIPYEKFLVDFPEDLQKESLVKSYERLEIGWQNFSEIFAEYFEAPDLKINSHDDIRTLLNPPNPPIMSEDREIREARYHTYQKNKEYFFNIIPSYEKLSEDQFQDKVKTSERRTGSLLEELINKLSDGKFPGTTLNHTLFGDWSFDNETWAKMIDASLFPEKICHPEAVKKYLEWATPVASTFIFIENKNKNRKKSVIIPFDGQQTEMSRIQFYGSGETNKGKYKVPYDRKDQFGMKSIDTVMEYLSKNNFALLTDQGGLNVMHRTFWRDYQIPFMPSFGFEPSENLFKKYLDEVDLIYKNLPDGVICDDLRESVKHILYSPDSDYEKIGKDVKFKHINIQHKMSKGVGFHHMLPILINSDTVPDLRWGYASYATIPTEESLNLLHIKHVDS